MKLDPLDISALLFHQSYETNGDDIEGQVDDELSSSVSNDNNHRLTYVGPISIRSTTTTAIEGRCLVATRKLDVGELLFITPPIVNANVQDVWDEYMERRTIMQSTSLADVAEYVLLHACKDAIAKQKYSVVSCLAALERSKRSDSNDHDGENSPVNSCNINRLLGRTADGINDGDDHERVLDDDGGTIGSQSVYLSDEDIIQIIRRNAFGADFPTTNRIEQRWLEVLDNVNCNIDSDIRKKILPSRLLGLYGLAAMINHSCMPNAVRVYSSKNDCMIVHTCQPIQEGEEIVWSYIPVIQPYDERQLLLQNTHNFICQCPRCCSESMSLSSGSVHEQLQDIQSRQSNNSMADVVYRLENEVLQQSTISNELKRYIRISNIISYMNYMNDTLPTIQKENATDNGAKLQNLLTIAFQLHLAFVVCHNVSTEHLSVRFIYNCYDFPTHAQLLNIAYSFVS